VCKRSFDQAPLENFTTCLIIHLSRIALASSATLPVASCDHHRQSIGEARMRGSQRSSHCGTERSLNGVPSDFDRGDGDPLFPRLNKGAGMVSRGAAGPRAPAPGRSTLETQHRERQGRMRMRIIHTLVCGFYLLGGHAMLKAFAKDSIEARVEVALASSATLPVASCDHHRQRFGEARMRGSQRSRHCGT